MIDNTAKLPPIARVPLGRRWPKEKFSMTLESISSLGIGKILQAIENLSDINRILRFDQHSPDCSPLFKILLRCHEGTLDEISCCIIVKKLVSKGAVFKDRRPNHTFTLNNEINKKQLIIQLHQQGKKRLLSLLLAHFSTDLFKLFNARDALKLVQSTYPNNSIAITQITEFHTIGNLAKKSTIYHNLPPIEKKHPRP